MKKKVLNTKIYLRRLNKHNNLSTYKQTELREILKIDLNSCLSFNCSYANFIQVSCIGQLYCSKLPNMDKLKDLKVELKQKQINWISKQQNDSCSFYFKSMCNLYGQIIIFADYTDNEIVVFDADFNNIKVIRSICGLKIDRPSCICTNDSNTIIYLINFGKQEILLIDKNLENIVKRVSKDDFGQEFYPVDCTFFRQSIFVLDRANCRILKLTEMGDFQEEFALFQLSNKSKRYDESEFLIWPLNIQVTYNIIAVLEDWKFIYIYDSNGCLKQILSDNATYSASTRRKDLPDSDIQTFIILDSYLIFHSSNGSISVFVEHRGVFKFLFKHHFPKLEVKSAHLCHFNGQFIITIKGEKSIFMI